MKEDEIKNFIGNYPYFFYRNIRGKKKRKKIKENIVYYHCKYIEKVMM